MLTEIIEALKNLGLIPHTPPPSIPATPSPVVGADEGPGDQMSEMSRAELEEEVRRLRVSHPPTDPPRNPNAKVDNDQALARKSPTVTKVKRERLTSAGPSSAGPSSNRIIKKRKKPMVIDLTND